jgi:predicted glutamine amidotransferase
MAAAMERTIARVLEIVGAHGDGTPSHLNCAVSDGNHAVVSRFTDDRREAPPTLYYFRGRLYPDAHPPAPDHAEPPPVIVSSERLTADDGWQLIPPNHLIVLSRDAEPELRSIAHLGAARSAA